MINFLRKKKPIRHISRFSIVVALVIVIGGSAYYFYNITVPISGNAQPRSFIVEPGWGSTRISHELKKSGFIANSLSFQFYTWTRGISSYLQDGEYTFSENMPLTEIASILKRGPGSTKEITLTLIEGWNNRDYATYLVKQGIVATEDEFFDLVQKKAGWWDDYSALSARPKNADLEGYLFPDTYRVYRESSAQEVIEKMLANLERKLTPELRQEITRQGKTIHEVLTIASILEKEVSTDEDRAMVADIFYKRLKAGIALQADSTVNYVSGKSDPRASGVDLQIDSPYNTYQVRGLPPGPIDNPGMSSITAAVYPKSNPYYYFLTTPEGKAIYSVTHDQHVAAKAKYYK